MALIPDLLHSCWIIETAKSSVLGERGQTESSVRAAQRARLIASTCANHQIKILPRLASAHASWMADVAGTTEETGIIGWFFLQRLSMYIDSHLENQMEPDDYKRLRELGAADEEEGNRVLAEGGLPEVPMAKWPDAPRAEVKEPTARFAILGDIHISGEDQNAQVACALDDIGGMGLDFAIAPGDLTKGGRDQEFEEALRLTKASPLEIGLTLGNHDMGGGADDNDLGPHRFTKVFDKKPYGVIENDEVRVVLLDSADPSPSPFPPFSILEGKFSQSPHDSIPGGKLSQEVIEWMAGVKGGKTTFIALHHPPHPYTAFPPIVFGLDKRSTEALKDLSRRVRPHAIFCGHTHRSELSYLDDTPVFEVPSLREWPYGFGVVEVGPKQWAFNLHEISASPPPKENDPAGYLFRRYAVGPVEARSFSGPIIN